MHVMKNACIDIVDQIVKETGYDWLYVSRKFNEALAQGVKPLDFFDNIVDDYCLGGI